MILMLSTYIGNISMAAKYYKDYYPNCQHPDQKSFKEISKYLQKMNLQKHFKRMLAEIEKD